MNELLFSVNESFKTWRLNSPNTLLNWMHKCGWEWVISQGRDYPQLGLQSSTGARRHMGVEAYIWHKHHKSVSVQIEHKTWRENLKNLPARGCSHITSAAVGGGGGTANADDC